MPNALSYRASQMRLVPSSIGVYALCDLDEVPIYVGKSEDGIRARVRRHLTSARSDVIANRQVDVWEIAFVWAWPVQNKAQLGDLEAFIFHRYNDHKTLMNGSTPRHTTSLGFAEPAMQRVQIMDDNEIATRRNPIYRFPRQIEQVERLVDHILNVKDSAQLRGALKAHFNRLTEYYSKFCETTIQETED